MAAKRKAKAKLGPRGGVGGAFLRLGAEVTRIRNGLGLTQGKFADLVGAHYMTVSRWERGIARPTPYVLAVIQVFGEAVDKGKQAAFTVRSVYEGSGAMRALYAAMQLVYVN